MKKSVTGLNNRSEWAKKKEKISELEDRFKILGNLNIEEKEQKTIEQGFR